MSKDWTFLTGMGHFSFRWEDLLPQDRYETTVRSISDNGLEKAYINVDSLREEDQQLLEKALSYNTSLKSLEIGGTTNFKLVKAIKDTLTGNRILTSLTFTSTLIDKESKDEINKYVKRNEAIAKITIFIIKNFSESKSITFSEIKREDYKFLKYYLHSNKIQIQENLAKRSFESNCNWDEFLSKWQFAFNGVCTDIYENGGYFKFLASEINCKIFSHLDDNGVPCIGE